VCGSGILAFSRLELAFMPNHAKLSSLGFLLASLSLLATAQGSAQACGTSQDPAAVVRAQVEAYNRHDLSAFLSCYADAAVVYQLDGSSPPAKGMEELKKLYAFLGRIPAAGAGYGVDVLQTVVTGPTVSNLEHVRGLPPNAPPPPNTLIVYEVRKGKIQNVWFAPSK
jgi:hypothetical protein